LHRLSKDEKAKNLAFFEQKENKIGKKIKFCKGQERPINFLLKLFYNQ